MTSDVHIESTINRRVNEGRSSAGLFILAYHKSFGHFFLHARLLSDFTSRFNRKSVILSLGFQASGSCDFVGGQECFRIPFFSLNSMSPEDPRFDDYVQYAHEAFGKFVCNFDQICEHALGLVPIFETNG